MTNANSLVRIEPATDQRRFVEEFERQVFDLEEQYKVIRYRHGDLELELIEDRFARLMATMLYETQRLDYWKYKDRIKAYLRWALDNNAIVIPRFREFGQEAVAAGRVSNKTIQNWISSTKAAYRRLKHSPEFQAAMKWRGLIRYPNDPAARIEEELQIYRMIEGQLEEDAGIKGRDTGIRRGQFLTKEEVERLLVAPGQEDLLGLRDTAMIALTVCTGIREIELLHAQVEDLRRQVEGDDGALHTCFWVREPKGTYYGKVERPVPYGDLTWGLELVDDWLETAGIEDGLVFRPLRGKKRYRVENRLPHNKFFGQRLKKYSIIAHDGKPLTVEPHSLRRTYGRRLHQMGFSIEAIADLLGHRNLSTTKDHYIGRVDVSRIAPLDYIYDGRISDRVKPPRKTNQEDKLARLGSPFRGKWQKKIMSALNTIPQGWVWASDVTGDHADQATRTGVSRAAKSLKAAGKIHIWKFRQGAKTTIFSKPGVRVFPTLKAWDHESGTAIYPREVE